MYSFSNYDNDVIRTAMKIEQEKLKKLRGKSHRFCQICAFLTILSISLIQYFEYGKLSYWVLVAVLVTSSLPSVFLLISSYKYQTEKAGLSSRQKSLQSKCRLVNFLDDGTIEFLTGSQKTVKVVNLERFTVKDELGLVLYGQFRKEGSASGNMVSEYMIPSFFQGKENFLGLLHFYTLLYSGRTFNNRAFAYQLDQTASITYEVFAQETFLLPVLPHADKLKGYPYYLKLAGNIYIPYSILADECDAVRICLFTTQQDYTCAGDQVFGTCMTITLGELLTLVWEGSYQNLLNHNSSRLSGFIIDPFTKNLAFSYEEAKRVQEAYASALAYAQNEPYEEPNASYVPPGTDLEKDKQITSSSLQYHNPYESSLPKTRTHSTIAAAEPPEYCPEDYGEPKPSLFDDVPEDYRYLLSKLQDTLEQENHGNSFQNLLASQTFKEAQDSPAFNKVFQELICRCPNALTIQDIKSIKMHFTSSKTMPAHEQMINVLALRSNSLKWTAFKKSAWPYLLLIISAFIVYGGKQIVRDARAKKDNTHIASDTVQKALRQMDEKKSENLEYNKEYIASWLLESTGKEYTVSDRFIYLSDSISVLANCEQDGDIVYVSAQIDENYKITEVTSADTMTDSSTEGIPQE